MIVTKIRVNIQVVLFAWTLNFIFAFHFEAWEYMTQMCTFKWHVYYVIYLHTQTTHKDSSCMPIHKKGTTLIRKWICLSVNLRICMLSSDSSKLIYNIIAARKLNSCGVVFLKKILDWFLWIWMNIICRLYYSSTWEKRKIQLSL